MKPSLEKLKNTKKHLTSISIIEYVNQYARKILINQLYGALGNNHFRFYDLRNAEAVTSTGQLVIQWGGHAISNKLNQILKTQDIDFIIYSDTDSVYVDIDQLMQMYIDRNPDSSIEQRVNKADELHNKLIQPAIDNAYQDLHKYMNSLEHLMFMDREIIASSAFWTAKKKYAAVVWDSEGDRVYDDTGHLTYKLKVMGLETQKSSTPPFAQKALKKAIEIMLTKDESDLQKYVKKVKEEYRSQPLDQIAQISSVNGFDKYIDTNLWVTLKGAGQNHKAAAAYNKLQQYHKDLEPIKSGDKIYMLRLTMPNTVGEVFGWPTGTKPPKEFNLDLENMMDLNTMIEKGFDAPLKLMAEAIGWQHEKKASLISLFEI